MKNSYLFSNFSSLNNLKQKKVSFCPPAFIVGKERSGTTLLSAILNRHPQICVTPETNFLYRLFNYPGGSDSFKLDWPDSLYNIIDSMLPTADWDKPARLVHERFDKNPVSGREAFIGLGETVSEFYGKTLWIEKTPNHIHCLSFIRELFPEAPIILIVRDGRDVAHSLTKVRFGSANFFENLWLWRQANAVAREFIDQDNNSIAIRYEDLTQHSERVVREVCWFLGVHFEACMLVPDGSEKALIDTTGNHMYQAAAPIDKTKVASWRKDLEHSKVRAAEMIVHDELEAWGYELITKNDHPKPCLRVSELTLVSRRYRDLYDSVLLAIAHINSPFRLTGVGSLLDSNPKVKTDAWVTDELPVPPSSTLSRMKIITFLIGLIINLMKFKIFGKKLVWIFLPSSDLSKRWWLHRIVERLMLMMSTLTILNIENEEIKNELRKYYGQDINKCLDKRDPKFLEKLLAIFT